MPDFELLFCLFTGVSLFFSFTALLAERAVTYQTAYSRYRFVPLVRFFRSAIILAPIAALVAIVFLGRLSSVHAAFAFAGALLVGAAFAVDAARTYCTLWEFTAYIANAVLLSAAGLGYIGFKLGMPGFEIRALGALSVIAIGLVILRQGYNNRVYQDYLRLRD